MADVIVESIDSFFLRVAPIAFQEQRGRWVFRGHAKADWKLWPSVARASHTSTTIEKFEKSIFESFQREAESFSNINLANDWEWLAFAQHHGLPTRMLDWTHNPLVALYFAVCEHETLDGELFILHTTKKVGPETLKKSPIGLSRCYKYYSRLVSPRIRAQEGLFVVFDDPMKPLDEHLREGWRVERFVIPKEAKLKLRYDLFRIGVHHSALFPDVDGLSARLRWQHSVNPPSNRL